MNENDFSRRLSQLRISKNISAREMSLAIGQNPGYINAIESGKAYPTMAVFFYICDYLKISPQKFFDYEDKNPKSTDELYSLIKKLNNEQMDALAILITSIVNKK